MLKKIAIVGIALGVLGLTGCQCEHQGEGQGVNAAALDSLRQVISSLEQELNIVKEEKQQCEAELESYRTQGQTESGAEKQSEGQGKQDSKPKTVKVSTDDKKVSVDEIKKPKGKVDVTGVKGKVSGKPNPSKDLR